MSDWNRVYQNLPKEDREALNDLVNAIFRQETGYYSKIDPRTQPKYVAKWLEIRDNVLANRQRFGRWLDTASSAVADFVLALPIFRSLDTRPEWIRVAEGEEKDGVKTIPGRENHPRIMEYIATCTRKFDARRRKAWEDMGDSEVQWCACFVNWCLEQAGIEGLGTGWAPSWEGWGRRISGPQQGAIVLFKWSWMNSPYKFDHIGFCQEKNGRFYLLGGNQDNDRKVSSIPFPRGDARYYCMPPGY
jgi:uncharacterized protein (TIGR02594 family)